MVEPPNGSKHPVIIMMGVCGCGKSTIGSLLAQRLNGRFLDGDDLHPPSNVEKMRSGTPLGDEDRSEWLEAILHHISQHDPADGPLVVACSALKRRYRERLRESSATASFIHLHGPRSLLEARMLERAQHGHHFMPISLLDSQLSTLEDPDGEPRTWKIGINDPPESVVQHIVELVS